MDVKCPGCLQVPKGSRLDETRAAGSPARPALGVDLAVRLSCGSQLATKRKRLRLQP